MVTQHLRRCTYVVVVIIVVVFVVIIIIIKAIVVPQKFDGTVFHEESFA